MGEGWSAWLGDLATYRPSDFLMFAPRTYWRLFELHNEAWWPLPVITVLLGTAGLAAAVRGGAAAQRPLAAGLAAAWAFVAWSFLAERFAPINWAAMGFAWLFAAQAALLVGHAVGVKLLPAASAPRRRAALALGAFAIWGYPWLSTLSGRPLAQAEVFGLAPDPTVLAMLAWLLGTAAAPEGPGRWVRGAAWAIACACAVASGATLATMGEWQAAVPLVATAVALALARRGARLKPRGSEARKGARQELK